MTYLNGHIGDAQEGVQYAGEVQTGGYEPSASTSILLELTRP